MKAKYKRLVSACNDLFFFYFFFQRSSLCEPTYGTWPYKRTIRLTSQCSFCIKSEATRFLQKLTMTMSPTYADGLRLICPSKKLPKAQRNKQCLSSMERLEENYKMLWWLTNAFPLKVWPSFPALLTRNLYPNRYPLYLMTHYSVIISTRSFEIKLMNAWITASSTLSETYCSMHHHHQFSEYLVAVSPILIVFWKRARFLLSV